MWIAAADYADGTRVERKFPYNEGGNYIREQNRQYELECWLMHQTEVHGNIEWYSVNYEEE